MDIFFTLTAFFMCPGWKGLILLLYPLAGLMMGLFAMILIFYYYILQVLVFGGGRN